MTASVSLRLIALGAAIVLVSAVLVGSA